MILEKIYLFLLIMLTGTVYAVVGNTVLLALSTVVLVTILFKNLNTAYNINLLGTYALMSAVLMLILFLHFLIVPLANSPLPYIGMLFRFISVGVFIIYLRNKQTDIASLLYGLLKIIAIHAIIAFVLSFFVSSLLIKVPTDDVNSYTFGYLFFYNSFFKVIGISFYRNQGLFWEPGILQIYMNILFFIVSFVKPNGKMQLLSAFLIVTTYSTTGIAILSIQLIIVLFTSKAPVIQKTLISIILAVVVVPLFLLNYSEKVNDDSADSDITSSALRLYDVLEGATIAKEYPLTGIGLSQESYAAFKKSHSGLTSAFSTEFSDFVLVRRSSNSVLYFLTRFGFPFSIFWFFLIYKQNLADKKKWLFFVIIIAENFSEPLLIEPFFLLIAASGFYGLFTFNFKAGSQSIANAIE